MWNINQGHHPFKSIKGKVCINHFWGLPYNLCVESTNLVTYEIAFSHQYVSGSNIAKDLVSLFDHSK